MSPSHHTRHTEPKSSMDTSSPTTRLPTPIVAAMAVGVARGSGSRSAAGPGCSTRVYSDAGPRLPPMK